MSGIGWLVVKSTALTIVLALLMFGWLRTVMTYTHVGMAGSTDRRPEVTQVQPA
jgi:hypothetical protein